MATGTAKERSTRAAAATSPAVSPLARSATRNAACSGSDHSPAISAVKHSSVVAAERLFPREQPLQDLANHARHLRADAREGEEVGQQVLAAVREVGLGVELHAEVGPLPVLEAHHQAVVRPGGDLELVGQRLPVRNQRVVARRGERVGKARKDLEPVVVNLRVLAVARLGGAHHPAAVRHGQRLVPEADPEQRHLGCGPDQLHAHPGRLRNAGPGGEHQRARPCCQDLARRRGVVADDPHLLVPGQLAQVLHEVVGEGVVVVHERDHGCISSASRSARQRARALLLHSASSLAGSESNTTPAPACTCTVPCETTAVRIAMQASMSPPKSK